MSDSTIIKNSAPPWWSGRKPSAKRGGIQSELLKGVQRQDTRAAERLKAGTQAADQLTQQVQSLRQSQKAEAKAAAAAEVARIKAEIDQLRRYGGDPRHVARKIAQLARELGQAVKAYARANAEPGGDGATAGAPRNPADSSTSSADARAASPTDSQAGATQGGTSATPTPQASVTAEATPATARGDARTTLEDPRTKGQTAPEDVQGGRIDSLSRRLNAVKGDQLFGDAVRDAIDKLRDLARKTARELAQLGEKDNRQLKEAAQALKEAEQAQRQIADQVAQQLAGVDQVSTLNVFA